MLRNAVQSHKETVLLLEEKQSAAEQTVLEKEGEIGELQAALRLQVEEAAEEVDRQVPWQDSVQTLTCMGVGGCVCALVHVYCMCICMYVCVADCC